MFVLLEQRSEMEKAQPKIERCVARVVVGGVLALVLVMGCRKAAPVPTGNSGNPGRPGGGQVGGATDVPAQFAAGRRVFEANCMKCHTTDGSTGAPGGMPGGTGGGGPGGGGPRGMMNKGPDLARIGADPTHTPQWIMDHIRDPQTHK